MVNYPIIYFYLIISALMILTYKLINNPSKMLYKLLVLVLLPILSYQWSEVGHMLTAAIA